MSASVLKMLIPFLCIAVLCSCSDTSVESEEYIKRSASLLESELVANEIDIIDTEVKISSSGGLSSASIMISVDNIISDDEAERIFTDIIFPYMSEENEVVENLQIWCSSADVYTIDLCYEQDGKEVHFSYRSDSSDLCERWENSNQVVFLEEFR